MTKASQLQHWRGQGLEYQDRSHAAAPGREQTLRKTAWRFLKKLNRHLPYDLVIPPLGICTGEMQADIPTKTCTQTFIATLFLTAPNWKQLKWPSTGE